MKYVNKEYGFSFRPPFSDKFREQTDDGPAVSDDNFPGRTVIGVGYHYDAVSGAMLVGKNGSMWGVRVLYLSGKQWVDGADAFGLGSDCENTADGSYAHYVSGPFEIEWARFAGDGIAAVVSAKRKLKVRVIFYPCCETRSELSIEGDKVRGRSPHMAVIPGSMELTDANAVFRGRYLAIDESKKEFFHAVSYCAPTVSSNGASGEAIMEFALDRHRQSVAFYATVGDEDVFEAEIPRLEHVQSVIEDGARRYELNKTTGSGLFGAPIERMNNAALWSRVYYPFFLTEIFTPKRRELNDHFDVDGTMENCMSVVGSYTGMHGAMGQLSHTAEDKIMAILALWHNCMHMTDRKGLLGLFTKLSKAYPPIATPVVAEKDKIEVAYKWRDSPIKEKYDHTPMFSLDLSSLKVLAFDVLGRIAAMLELPEKKKYIKAKTEMIKVVNDTFWCDKAGMYLNKYTTGYFASSMGATSFYPLIAGAVDTAEKLSRLINNLTDKKKFWGDYVIPTLSIDDREYGKPSRSNNGSKVPPYLNYRGSIVPYVNYIIYHGLKRYGLDELASAFAQKSAALWAQNEGGRGLSYSLYLPRGRIKGDKYLSASGYMLALIGVQELIDVEYFRPDMKSSLAFGTYANGTHTLKNVKLLGSAYDVEVSDEMTSLNMDGVHLFKGAGGKFVVRNFVLDGNGGGEFMISSKNNISINMEIPTKSKTEQYFFIVPPGKSVVRATGGMVNITKIN